jgi:hypothetical protein
MDEMSVVGMGTTGGKRAAMGQIASQLPVSAPGALMCQYRTILQFYSFLKRTFLRHIPACAISTTEK